MYDTITLLKFFGNIGIDHFEKVLCENEIRTSSDLHNTRKVMDICAPAASTCGTFEEYIAAIGILSDYGIRGETSGRTLQCLYALPSSTGTHQSLSELLNTLKNTLSKLGEQRGMQYLRDTYGRNAIPGILSLIEASDRKLKQLTMLYMNV